MAKDGSNRGGARPGAGRKKKSVKQAENVAKILELHQGGEQNGFPPPDDLLSEKQGGDVPLKGSTVYYGIFEWLKENNAEKIVPKELVELFAMSYARWLQSENMISKTGFLASHPTTGAPCTSPIVQVSVMYAKQAQQYWYAIWSAAKDADREQDEEDMMGKLLHGAG